MAVNRRLRWITDPTVALLDAKSLGLDPYSHWILAYGRDFDFNSLETIDEDGDFSYLAVVDEAKCDIRIKNDFLLADLLEFPVEMGVPRLSVIKAIAEALEQLEQQGAQGSGPRHVFRLPLRRRSLPPLPAAGSDEPIDEVEFPSADMTAPPVIDQDAPLVITAIIDDHVNVLHERFRTASGTRVDFAWFQDGVFDGAVPFGREVTKAEIDTAVRSNGTKTDFALLRELGLVDFGRPGHNPLALRASHGTHVLDLAAGAEPDGANIRNWRIITVSLPSLVTFETSGVFLGVFFLMGLQYILKRARELSVALEKPAELVINCSYGIAGGPHDGGHFVERTIEQLIAEFRRDQTVDIVLPAGNGNLDRGHAAVVADETHAAAAPETAGEDPRKNVKLELPWRLQPSDLTSSYLEIWLPGDARNLAMSITVPGDFRQPIPLSDGPQLLCEGIDDGLPVSPVARVQFDGGGENKQRIVVATAPTVVTDGRRRAAPAGLWQLEVSADLTPGQRMDAWVQRDASPIGSRVQGRQARFDDPAYKRFDDQKRLLATDPDDTESVVQRKGTINGVATGRSPFVVAGYAGNQKGRTTAPYSGTGFAAGRAPDLAALSDHSTVTQGIMAAGTNSGSRVAINGTSVAAPLVARELANLALQGVGLPGPSRATAMLGRDQEENSVVLDPETSESARVGAGWLGYRQMRR